MVTPVPIPNTEVKHLYADGSKLNLARVGSCQAFSLILRIANPRNRVFIFIYFYTLYIIKCIIIKNSDLFRSYYT